MEEKVYSIHIYCTVCKNIMEKSTPQTPEDLKEVWGYVVRTAPINLGHCKECKGAGQVYPDINTRYEIKLYDIGAEQYVEPKDIIPQ